MIQRIQSLYVFLYIIIKCYLLYKFVVDKNSFHFFINGFDVFCLLLISLILFSTITLFSFKNRKLQIILLFFLILIQLIILSSIFIKAYKSINPIKYLHNYQTYNYLLGLFLLLFSLKGIKKDQNLIDSIDRIR